MTDVLHPYQVEGADYLASRRRAYLGDEPGLGKTAQALVAAGIREHLRPLVVCPAGAVPVWEAEYEHWKDAGYPAASLPPLVYSYDTIVRRTSLYENLLARLQTEGSAGGCDLLIIDEAQYCKNPEAQRTHRIGKLANNAKTVWALSGTPMLSDATDLWPMLRAVWPDLLKSTVGSLSLDAFRDHFYNWWMSDYGPRCGSEKNPGELTVLLDAFMLRRTLDEVGLQLPPLYITQTPVMAVMTAGLKELEDELADNEEAQDRDPRLRKELGIAKVPATLQLIADSIEHTPTIIFAYHHDVLDALEEALAPYNPMRIDGTVPGTKRIMRVWNFQNEKSNLFLGQIGSCQTAITLSRAERVIIVEPSWTPNENLQAIKRAHRIGTTRPVRAEILVAKNNLDEAIQRRCRVKERLVEAAINPVFDLEGLL